MRKKILRQAEAFPRAPMQFKPKKYMPDRGPSKRDLLIQEHGAVKADEILRQGLGSEFNFTGSPETQYHHRHPSTFRNPYDEDALYERARKGLPIHASHFALRDAWEAQRIARQVLAEDFFYDPSGGPGFQSEKQFTPLDPMENVPFFAGGSGRTKQDGDGYDAVSELAGGILGPPDPDVTYADPPTTTSQLGLDTANQTPQPVMARRRREAGWHTIDYDPRVDGPAYDYSDRPTLMELLRDEVPEPYFEPEYLPNEDPGDQGLEFGQEDVVYGLVPPDPDLLVDPGFVEVVVDDWPDPDHGRREAARGDAQWGADAMRAIEQAYPYPGITTRENIGDAPSSGYMVSYPGYEVQQSMSTLSPQDLREYVLKHQDILDSDPNNYYGGWGEKGKWYHDVSRNVSDLRDAAEMALDGDQLAVYDLDRDEAIDTPDLVNMATHPGIGVFARHDRR